LCVQSRLVCSAGGSSVRVKARSPVAWIAASIENHIWSIEEIAKLIDSN